MHGITGEVGTWRKRQPGRPSQRRCTPEESHHRAGARQGHQRARLSRCPGTTPGCGSRSPSRATSRSRSRPATPAHTCCPPSQRMDVRRGMLGGRKLVVKTIDAPDSLALEVLQRPQRVRGGRQTARRSETRGASAPRRLHPLRARDVPVTDRRDRGRSSERRPSSSGASCAAATAAWRPGAARLAPDPGSTHVYDRCTGCLRRVEADSDASAT